MASLANKDSYLQKMAKKICTTEVCEPRKRKFGAGPGDAGPHPRKKKKRRKTTQKQIRTAGVPPSKQTVPDASQPSSAKPKNAGMKKSPLGAGDAPSMGGSGNTGGKVDDKRTPGSFSAMNLLRQRLHEKIREVSGQAANEALSPAVLEKRQRRKYERERKKRRRKELRMKEKMEQKEAEGAPAAAILESQEEKKENQSEMVFNKVDVGEEEKSMSKAEKRREKRKKVKGNITPLTGKNYKQLLSRLESRKSKLEELREKDEKKAQELEKKMKWTNVLYKAEGVKIRDDEEKLKAALKHKEKRKAQRQKQWEKRTEHVADKMQQRQEKRRKNLQKKKVAKIERKKAKARKKGRILPEDLEKAGFK